MMYEKKAMISIGGCYWKKFTEKRQKERQESRGAPATLKGYMIKLNQLAVIILELNLWKLIFHGIQSSRPVNL